MLAWRQFLMYFSGSVVFPSRIWHSSQTLQLFTDASAEIGFGAFFNGRWTHGKWPLSVRLMQFSIAFLELFPIVLALRLWGPVLSNKCVIFWSDNEAVVTIINRQTSRCCHIMQLVRTLVICCLELNIHFKARHIPGIDNGIADALSRFQMARFRHLAPGADPNITPLPADLWNIFS